MNATYELIMTVFFMGVISTATLISAFWFVWTETRRYTDREIKKAKREMRKELR